MSLLLNKMLIYVRSFKPNKAQDWIYSGCFPALISYSSHYLWFRRMTLVIIPRWKKKKNPKHQSMSWCSSSIENHCSDFGSTTALPGDLEEVNLIFLSHFSLFIKWRQCSLFSLLQMIIMGYNEQMECEQLV